MTRVLLIRRGGLGDTLLTVPLLRSLRRAHPEAAVHIAGTRECCDVLAAYGVVDAAHSAEDFELWLPERAQGRLRDFALVLGDEPSCVQRVLDPGAFEPGEPFALQFCRQAELEPQWPDDSWLVPPHRVDSGSVVLAPGSGGRAKCWHRDGWLQLADEIQALGRTIDVLLGPVERERDDPSAWPWRGDISFVEEPDLVRLSKWLEGVEHFVGNDSGTTHLAAALGVPTLAVFQATDPSVWAPVGPHVRVAGADGAAPTVEQVVAVLTGA